MFRLIKRSEKVTIIYKNGEIFPQKESVHILENKHIIKTYK
jgi:hypothetical protein